MIAMLRKWFRSRQRALDADILWSQCVAQAPDEDHARAAFAVHAFADWAYSDMTDRMLREYINALPYPTPPEREEVP